MLGFAKLPPAHGYLVYDFLNESRIFMPHFCDIMVLCALPRLLSVSLNVLLLTHPPRTF